MLYIIYTQGGTALQYQNNKYQQDIIEIELSDTAKQIHFGIDVFYLKQLQRFGWACLYFCNSHNSIKQSYADYKKIKYDMIYLVDTDFISDSDDEFNQLKITISEILYRYRTDKINELLK